MVERTNAQAFRRAHRIIRAAVTRAEEAERAKGGWETSCRLEEIRLVEGYAEPGYGCTDSLIAFGNWNTVTTYNRETSEHDLVSDLPERVGNLLDKLGFSCEWCDEWATCDSCQRAVRTQADSYCWTRSYVDSDGEITCEDCTLEDPAEYLESLEGNARAAITLSVDPTDHGYVLAGDNFEHGFHEGQAADPSKIAQVLEDLGISRFVFNIDSVGQFDMSFSVYVHEDDIEGDAAALRKAVEEGETDQYPSPATCMKAALQDASTKMSALDGPGIKYASCNPDGTADVRLVSRQEFVEGIRDE